jgi:hypothetical protein
MQLVEDGEARSRRRGLEIRGIRDQAPACGDADHAAHAPRASRFDPGARRGARRARDIRGGLDPARARAAGDARHDMGGTRSPIGDRGEAIRAQRRRLRRAPLSFSCALSSGRSPFVGARSRPLRSRAPSGLRRRACAWRATKAKMRAPPPRCSSIARPGSARWCSRTATPSAAATALAPRPSRPCSWSCSPFASLSRGLAAH